MATFQKQLKTGCVLSSLLAFIMILIVVAWINKTEPLAKTGRVEDIDRDVSVRRLMVLHRACEKLGFDVTNLSQKYSGTKMSAISHKILVNEAYKFTLFGIPKTGCTSWRLALLENSCAGDCDTVKKVNDGEKRPGLFKVFYTLNNSKTRVGTTLNKSTLLLSLKTYFTVLTVRNPLDRLESAYVDKVIGSNLYSVRQRILEKRNISHDEVERLAKDGRHIMFAEFLQHACVTPNDHWRGIYDQAFPCSIPYRYIAKTESLNQDLKHVIQTKLGGHGTVLNLNNMRTTADNGKRGRYLPLFSNLTNQKYWLSKVEKMYKNDMELFGYSYTVHNTSVYATCKEYDHLGICV